MKNLENGIFSTFIRLDVASRSASQTPDKSGFPSRAFGAGAERFGLPSRVRGIEPSEDFIHCAEAGAGNINRVAATAATIEFIAPPVVNAGTLCLSLTGCGKTRI